MSGIRKELHQFIELLKKEWGDALISAILFGSQASGEAKSLSDIDLLLIHDNPPKQRLQRHQIIFKLAQKISDSFADKLSAILLNSKEASFIKPYYLDMTVACEFLYDRDNFFKKILEGLKQRLKALGSKRVFDLDGNPYWILKENAKPGEEIIL